MIDIALSYSGLLRVNDFTFHTVLGSGLEVRLTL